MSQLDDDDVKQWTDNDLKEAMRRFNAGEIDVKEVEVCYGIPPRTIHRQKAMENIRAQLNPEKAKKLKTAGTSAPKKDPTVLRKPVDISCSSVKNVAELLDSGTEEIKQLLSNECNIIYECKVCKNLFRSLVNFISHKRGYCCDAYNIIHSRASENDDGSKSNDALKADERIKYKENARDIITKPLRLTCRKDLTSVLRRITALTDVTLDEPVIKLHNMDNTSCAYHQVIHPILSSSNVESPRSNCESNISNDTLDSESKKEIVMITGTADTELPNFVSGKRFRCPVCKADFTIQKSVIRHLKTVHNKSAEQCNKLKGRILSHFNNKIVEARENKELAEDEHEIPSAKMTKASANKISDPTISGFDKGNTDWQKCCPLCSRRFTNRKSFAAHMKGCRKQDLQRENGVEILNANKTQPLIPIVSLTPIESFSIPSKINHDDFINDKVSSDGSNKSSLIQVRMNYRKDVPSQSSSICVATGNTSSVAFSGLDRSRSNSVAMKENIVKSTVEVVSKHCTRHEERSVNLPETFSLRDDIIKSQPAKHDENTPDGDAKILPKNRASIYCEDCGMTFALNDYKCNLDGGLVRNYRCALRNCDFRCSDNAQLLPHMTEKHEVMLEGELAQVKSFFIAESTGQNTADCNPNCKTSNTNRESCNERSSKGNNKSCSSKSTNIKISKNQAVSSAHKVLVCANKPPEKINCEKKISSSKNEVKLKDGLLNNSALLTQRLSKTSAKVVKVTNLTSSSNTVTLPSMQKQKKKRNISTENKCRTVHKRKSMAQDNRIVVNGGLSLSSDEENEMKAVVSKLNFDLPPQKQNSFSVQTKMDKSLHKHIACCNDLSSSSSAPDSDFDPPTMNQDHLKESVMTIIFGKNVPTEKIHGNVSGFHKELPVSLTPSLANEKDQRGRSLRIAKRAIISKNVPSANKEEKVPKIPLSNKMNASR